MAYLMVKRVWNDELVELMGVRLRREEAMRLWKIVVNDQRNLAMVYEQDRVTDHKRNGEVWIEVEAGTGDLLTDPACFGFEDAKAVLSEKLGATPEIVARLLTDERTQRLYDELKAEGAAYFLRWKTPAELEA